MKSNANSTSVATKNSKHLQTSGKKSTARNMDSTPATERAKAKSSHGGMNNEGTNVNYEEQR